MNAKEKNKLLEKASVILNTESERVIDIIKKIKRETEDFEREIRNLKSS